LGESIESSELTLRVVGYRQASGVENSLSLDVKPVIAINPIHSISCGGQSVSSTVVVSDISPVVTKVVPVVEMPSPELVSILKRVPSIFEIIRCSTASPVEVVFDSSGCSKSGIDRKSHKHSDKEASALSSAIEGVTVETVDKSVKFILKKTKDKTRPIILMRVILLSQNQ